MAPDMVSLLIFIFAYLLFILLPNKRAHIAVTAAILLIVFQALSFKDAVSSINWNVMGIFVGTLAVAGAFMESKVPAYIAEVIVNRLKSTGWAVLTICLITSFISAFVENVATVLIVAPIAISLAKKLKVNLVNMMIAIAISSNLQGAATLIGDPPSMLLGGFARMNFMDFFVYKGKPGIFFAVQLGAIASFVVLYFIFRQYKEKVRLVRTEAVKSWVPTFLLGLLVFCLAISSFFDMDFSYLAGAICMIFGIISLFWERFANKKPLAINIKSLDWETALFLGGIFVIVGALAINGWIEQMAVFLSGLVGSNIFLGYTMLVLVSVIVSAFVDNVPLLVGMLPVAISMSDKLHIGPSLFLFGLLIGASLGGNITPIGASVNIVACGLLKKEGYKVSFKDFSKIGLPFTAAAVAAAYLFIWFVWSK